MIDSITEYILESINNETKLILSLIDSNPNKLKEYIEKTYKKEILILLNKLKTYFNEPVGLHYTFTDKGNDWSLDLDFYLINNKLKYPIATAGRKNLPVCFVIMAPGHKVRGKKERQITDEAVYIIDIINGKKKIRYLYKKKVNDINWKRLFHEAIKGFK